MGILHDLNQRLKEASIERFKRKVMLIGLSYILLAAVFALSLALPQHKWALFFIGFPVTAAMLVLSAFSIFKNSMSLLKEIRSLITRFLESVGTYHPKLKLSLSKLRANDFTHESVTSEDGEELQEYSELFSIVRGASEKFKSSNMQNQRISFDLAKSIQKLVETSNIQASGSSEQASSVAEITATMEELARTAAQIAENSNKVAKQAEDSDKASKDGFELVNNVIQSIRTIDTKMNQISQKTQILGTQSKQIGKVLDIIHDIGNETHLLALNATIESVAAGEFGKRFGVVAAEVRRLAESARENAESTKAIIEEFQNSINTTILAIDEGSKMSSNVNRMAQEINKHLSNITDTVAQTSQNASEISIATQQQRSASDQIVLTLKDVTEVTKLQAQELKKSSGELEKLNGLALGLQLLTQHVVIDSPLSLGYKIRKLAEREEIFNMDKRLQQQTLQDVMKDNQYIELFYIADDKGSLFSWCSREMAAEASDLLRVGTDCSNRPWFMNSANSAIPYISEVYKSLVSKEDCFSVSIGIHDAECTFKGVITLDVNTKEWNKMVL
ncbi:MAG: hypothetical protein GY765_24825 [bacterium]|nr:hypothetical protein [bacterium]